MRSLAVALLMCWSVGAGAQFRQMAPILQRVPVAPGPPPAPVATDMARKIEVLNIAGLRDMAGGIREPVVLSARRPWIDERTFMEPVGAISYFVRDDYVTLPNDGDVSAFLKLYWPDDAAKRYIVDCSVVAPAGKIRFSSGGAPRTESEVTVVGGRVAAVLPPGSGGTVTLTSTQGWRMKGCEITPVG